MEKIYDRFRAAKAQEEFCARNHLPLFAPKNGYCYNCAGNIYDPVAWHTCAVSGYSIEEAGSRLITSCPHCHKSFTD